MWNFAKDDTGLVTKLPMKQSSIMSFTQQEITLLSTCPRTSNVKVFLLYVRVVVLCVFYNGDRCKVGRNYRGGTDGVFGLNSCQVQSL